MTFDESLLDEPERAEFRKYRRAVETNEYELSFIRGHLLIEHYLERLIRIPIAFADYLFENGRLSFSQKLVLVESFGLLHLPEMECARQINRIRNKFAHTLDHTPTDADAEAVGAPLGEYFTQLKTEHGTEPRRLLGVTMGIVICGLAAQVLDYEKEARDGRSYYGLLNIPCSNLPSEVLNDIAKSNKAGRAKREKKTANKPPTSTP